MKKQLAIFAFSLLLLCPGIANSKTDNIWEKFLKEPNSSNYKLCEKQIQNAVNSSQNPNNIINTNLVNDDVLYKKFISLLGKNVFATRLGFQLLPFVDGAKAEELVIALGKTIKHDAKLFLTLLMTYNVTEEDMKSMLLNYGDEYVDNINKTITETQNRIKKIEQVNVKSLAAIKKKCLQILKEHKAQLANIKKESSPNK